jgi:ABC-2 type transport system ATP-binding protein
MSVIEVKNLRKVYRDHVAIEDVSFSVEQGEIFGILGPNGAGKTTTVEIIEGLRVPDGGSVSVLGLDPHKDAEALRTRVGIQLQESELPDRLRVIEALEMYASFYPNAVSPEKLLTDWNLQDKRKSFFKDLSGGQKQRLFIALALVGSPEFVVLDELTTGLDPQARRDTWKHIEDVRASGVTVLLVTHFMEEAERLCDRLAVFDGGRIVAIDTPAGLVARVDSEQRLRFRLPLDFDETRLTSLPDVVDVTRQGEQIVVTGNDNVLNSVTSLLAREQVIARELRVEQASLDDAFVALTGRKLDA